MTAQRDPDPVPVVFGEVLFDVFPGGEEVLGGAAFNAAWNLKGLGLAPFFISRVGQDRRGDRVLAAMDRWGLRTDGVQVDPERPTGVVEVTVRDGQPTYSIVAHQAYDRIDTDEAMSRLAGESAAILYHGTLALRSEPSRRTAEHLRSTLGVPVFVDVNLRAPWWTVEEVDVLLRGSTWAKLNDDEVRSLSPGRVELRAAAAELQERLAIEHLIVTRGEHGAAFYLPDGTAHEVPASPVQRVEDTVGAGDAFSAVLLLGALRGWSATDMLERAAGYAAEVCKRRGATSLDTGLYEPWRLRWESGDALPPV